MLAICVDHYEIDNGMSRLWTHENLTKSSAKQPKRYEHSVNRQYDDVTYHIWTCTGINISSPP